MDRAFPGASTRALSAPSPTNGEGGLNERFDLANLGQDALARITGHRWPRHDLEVYILSANCQAQFALSAKNTFLLRIIFTKTLLSGGVAPQRKNHSSWLLPARTHVLFIIRLKLPIPIFQGARLDYPSTFCLDRSTEGFMAFQAVLSQRTQPFSASIQHPGFS
jgi:hypothetical protein